MGREPMGEWPTCSKKEPALVEGGDLFGDAAVVALPFVPLAVGIEKTP
jgi:hypothetical protein